MAGTKKRGTREANQLGDVVRGAVLMKFMGILSVKLPGGFEVISGAPTSVDRDPRATVVSAPARYTKTVDLQNASGVDWVAATCPDKNERVIFGLCVINSEDGWGWLLQNAGILDETTWGCAYGSDRPR